MNYQIPTPLEQIPLSPNHEVYIKRDDLIHPLVSGNKYRKLIGFIQSKVPKKIRTYGGPFSNHIHACAYFCHAHQIECELVVRGKDADPDNPTLADAIKWNAKLSFVDRNSYRELKKERGWYNENELSIPEGGWGEMGFAGLKTLVDELDDQLGPYDHIILAVGSATTLCGIAKHVERAVNITGIRAVRDESLDERIQEHTTSCPANIKLLKNYEWGGFAKYDDSLLEFIEEVEKEFGLPLDFIYNAKAFYALIDLIEQGYFRKGSRIVYLHTGGLQGNRGLVYRQEKGKA